MFQLTHVLVTHVRILEHAEMMVLEDSHVFVVMAGQGIYVKYVRFDT